MFNPEDDVLEPGDISEIGPFYYLSNNSGERQPVYYPFYEQDLSLGQNGSQSNISKPQANYADVDVRVQIPILTDADRDRNCDYQIPKTSICTITEIGDNHGGYMGFRKKSIMGEDVLLDNGVIDTVVNLWNNVSNSNSSN